MLNREPQFQSVKKKMNKQFVFIISQYFFLPLAFHLQRQGLQQSMCYVLIVILYHQIHLAILFQPYQV